MIWVAAILALLGLVLVLLALPLHARIRGGLHDGEPFGSVAVRWAFGLLGVELRPRGYELRVAGLRLRRPYPERTRRKRERSRRRERRRSAEPEGRARPDRERRRASLGNHLRLLGMASRLLRALHLRLRLRGEVGTGDPADAALLSGILRALRALPGVEPEVKLDWLDEVLELEAEGSARVWIPELAAVALLLLLRRENRAALRAVRS